jgi:hypothetical protein
MRAWIAVLLLLSARPAVAQDIHKCVSGKEVSYQSEPCAPGQAHVKTWGTEITSGDAYGKVRPARQPAVDPGYLARQAHRARNGAGPATVIGPGASSVNACEEMKRQRDAYLDSEHGRHTGYDGRRAWNDRVYDACK